MGASVGWAAVLCGSWCSRAGVLEHYWSLSGNFWRSPLQDGVDFLVFLANRSMLQNHEEILLSITSIQWLVPVVQGRSLTSKAFNLSG